MRSVTVSIATYFFGFRGAVMREILGIRPKLAFRRAQDPEGVSMSVFAEQKNLSV